MYTIYKPIKKNYTYIHCDVTILFINLIEAQPKECSFLCTTYSILSKKWTGFLGNYSVAYYKHYLEIDSNFSKTVNNMDRVLNFDYVAWITKGKL